MQTLAWSRQSVLEEVRRRVWLYLTPASTITDAPLETSVLLELGERDLQALANVLFLMSDEVGALLADAAELRRRLPTSSVVQEERSFERIRGPVRWQQTFVERGSVGSPHLFVTAPVDRAYATPENELLTYLLRAVVALGRGLGWEGSKGQAGRLVAGRVDEAARLLSVRTLSQLGSHEPAARQLARVRTGRHRRRFASALRAWDLHQGLVRHLEAHQLRSSVERGGLVVQSDDRLFEVWCLFLTLQTLASEGWALPRPRIFSGGLRTVAMKDHQRLIVYFQTVPAGWREVSRYRLMLQAHGIGTTDFQPDLILVLSEDGVERSLLVEVKMGKKRTAAESSREALQNLLAYESAYADRLHGQRDPVGLGVAWGQGLDAQDETIMLTTVDRMDEGNRRFLGP